MKTSTLVWLSVLFVLLTFGGCTASGNGWSIDNGVQYARIQQQGATERERIDANRDALLAESRERTTEAVAPWAAGTIIAIAIAAAAATASSPSDNDICNRWSFQTWDHDQLMPTFMKQRTKELDVLFLTGI